MRDLNIIDYFRERTSARVIFKNLVVIILALSSQMLISSNANAQCINMVGIITCGIDDTDGHLENSNITNFIINNGVTVSDQGAEAAGRIIDIQGNITGEIINNGTIKDFGVLDDFGIYSSGTINSFINNGTIDVGEHALHSQSDINSIVNNGTIISTDDAIDSNGTIGSLINFGTITSGDDAVYTNVLTSLINYGTITGGDDGVYANRLTSLINYGTIRGNGDDAVYSYNTAGSIINYGSIIGINYGVYVDDNLTSLTNRGIISGGVDGIRTYNHIVSLTNSGTITGGDDGIDSRHSIMSLTNSGTITGADNAIFALSYIGTLINSGVITGGTNAIFENASGDTTLMLLPGSDIFGAINLGGGVNTLVVDNGLSIDHVFATTPEVVNSNGAPLFIIGNRVVVVDGSIISQQDEFISDLSRNIFNTAFHHNRTTSTLSSQLNNGVTPQYSLGALEADDVTAVDLDRTNGWANAFGSRRYKNAGDGADLRHNLAGFMAGMDGQVNSRLRLGGFFGTANTDIETARDQQKSEIESVFGGLYASYSAENITFKFGLAGGATEHDSFRFVDNNQQLGLQKVSSSLRGSFIAPELLVSQQSEWNAIKIQTTLRVGYTGLFLDGSTESGTDAPLATDDMNLHLLNARFELAALYSSQTAQGYSYNFSPYIGVEGRSIVKGRTVNTRLLGQSFNLDVSDKDNVASAFIGFRSSLQYTEDLNFFAQTEGLAASDDNKVLSGNIGFKWQF